MSVDTNPGRTRDQPGQWLRWNHEVTVIEVVDTADGTYVYTFETSLPDDFQAPLQNVKPLMDWNRIILK